MSVVCAGKHTSGVASSFPLTRTRTKHTLPDVPSTRRLHYPSTLMSTEAEGRQTAVRVCPRRRDAQRCLRGRDAAGHVSVGPPLAFLPSACVPHCRVVWNLPAERARGSYGHGCRSELTCRRWGAPGNPLPLLARGNGTPGLSACSRSGSAHGGASESSARKAKDELANSWASRGRG